MRNIKYKHNLICLSACVTLFIFLLSQCNYKQDAIREKEPNVNNDKTFSIISYLEKNGVKNYNSTFLNFLIENDTVKIEKYMRLNSLDSIFLIPGSFPINNINQTFSLKLPGGETPEGKSFIIFKDKTSYKEFVCFSDDTLGFDLKSYKKLGYSIADSNLLMKKRKYPNGRIVCRISNK
jgi:hypothetical protein